MMPKIGTSRLAGSIWTATTPATTKPTNAPVSIMPSMPMLTTPLRSHRKPHSAPSAMGVAPDRMPGAMRGMVSMQVADELEDQPEERDVEQELHQRDRLLAVGAGDGLRARRRRPRAPRKRKMRRTMMSAARKNRMMAWSTSMISIGTSARICISGAPARMHAEEQRAEQDADRMARPSSAIAMASKPIAVPNVAG